MFISKEIIGEIRNRNDKDKKISIMSMFMYIIMSISKEIIKHKNKTTWQISGSFEADQPLVATVGVPPWRTTAQPVITPKSASALDIKQKKAKATRVSSF